MKKKAIRICGILVLPVVLYLVFSILTPSFGSHTIPIFISQSMIPIALGLTQCGIMMTGLIDFSAGARMLFGAVCGGILSAYLGLPGLLIGCLAGSMIGALLMGLIYKYLKIPSMVVSLGIVFVVEALTEWTAQLFGNSNIIKVSEDLSSLGSFPYNIVITAVACVLFYYFIYKTKIGCLIFAVGNDEAMLRNMGVNTDKVKFMTFIVSGVFCAFASLLQICYAGTVAAMTGFATLDIIFKPMMGVFIGMELIKFMDNMPLMIVIGEVVIAIIFNGFIALGMTDNIQNIILGIFLLAVMGFSANSQRISEIRRKREVRRHAVENNPNKIPG